MNRGFQNLMRTFLFYHLFHRCYYRPLSSSISAILSLYEFVAADDSGDKAYIYTGNNSEGNFVCFSFLIIFKFEYLNKISKYSVDRVTLLSSRSTVKISVLPSSLRSLAKQLSLTQMIPPGRKALLKEEC